MAASHIKAVLLDAGGTLIEPLRPVGETYADAAARYGATFEPAAIEAAFREQSARTPRLSFSGVPPSALDRLERRWWERFVEGVIPRQSVRDFDAMFEELFEFYAHSVAWRVFEDAVPALNELRHRGVVVAIVSNFDARLFRICDELGLAAKVAAVCASSRMGYSKPDPRIFQAALRRIGVGAANALHVGDSIGDDLEGARNAGLQALLIDRQAGERQAHVITDLRQIAECL